MAASDADQDAVVDEDAVHGGIGDQDTLADGSLSDEQDGPADDFDLPEQTPPESGEVLFGADQERYSQLTVDAADGKSSYVKLKDLDGNDLIGFYVAAGDKVTVDVPAVTAVIYFASGEKWYGEEALFGPSTVCRKDDDETDFSTYSIELTLYPVFAGNAHTEDIPIEDF